MKALLRTVWIHVVIAHVQKLEQNISKYWFYSVNLMNIVQTKEARSKESKWREGQKKRDSVWERERARKREETTKKNNRKTIQCESNFCYTFTQKPYLQAKKMLLCSTMYSMASSETKAKYTTYEIYLLHTYFQLHFEQLNNICTLSIRYTQNKKVKRAKKKLEFCLGVLSRFLEIDCSVSVMGMSVHCKGEIFQLFNILCYIKFHIEFETLESCMKCIQQTLSPTQKYSDSAYWNFIPTLQFDHKFRMLKRKDILIRYQCYHSY